MTQIKFEYDTGSFNNSAYKQIYWLGGWACILFIAYCLLETWAMTCIGVPPTTASECFSMLAENRFHGLLRLDILTVFAMPLYYLLYYSIYVALKKTNEGLVTISTILVFVGITLFLATPSVFSYLDLSDKYAAATSELQKNRLLAAGEAIIASDMWHGTGSHVGGLMLQTGALLISWIMLKSNAFNKLTTYTGILTNGLDLLHIVVAIFLPNVGMILMDIAGVLYLVWFPLVAISLFKLGKINNN